MSVGPSPRFARAAASFVTFMTANRSLPSTFTPGMPYAIAFDATSADPVCRWNGTEIAHWLLRQKRIVGALNTPAKFAPTWNSFDDVAPSPKYERVQIRSPLYFAPIAAPTA